LSVHMYYNPVTGAWTCNNGDASADVAIASATSNTVANVGANTIPSSVIPKSCG